MTTAVPTVVSGSFLTLHYRLTGPDGADVVNTFHDKPATLTIGSGELSPRARSPFDGPARGHPHRHGCPQARPSAPQPGNGAESRHDPHARAGIPDETWRVGDVVRFPPDNKSSFAGVVRELGGNDWILFDFNHPLAGQPVTFEVQLIGVL